MCHLRKSWGYLSVKNREKKSFFFLYFELEPHKKRKYTSHKPKEFRKSQNFNFHVVLAELQKITISTLFRSIVSAWGKLFSAPRFYCPRFWGTLEWREVEGVCHWAHAEIYSHEPLSVCARGPTWEGFELVSRRHAAPNFIVVLFVYRRIEISVNKRHCFNNRIMTH